jgi:hypothetical protein
MGILNLARMTFTKQIKDRYDWGVAKWQGTGFWSLHRGFESSRPSSILRAKSTISYNVKWRKTTQEHKTGRFIQSSKT